MINVCLSLDNPWLCITFSLFCSMEEPSHAHRDKLFHSESFPGWCAGHHHLPACESCGGHHRDVVLWKHSVQNCPLSAGKPWTLTSAFQTGYWNLWPFQKQFTRSVDASQDPYFYYSTIFLHGIHEGKKKKNSFSYPPGCALSETFDVTLKWFNASGNTALAPLWQYVCKKDNLI